MYFAFFGSISVVISVYCQTEMHYYRELNSIVSLNTYATCSDTDTRWIGVSIACKMAMIESWGNVQPLLFLEAVQLSRIGLSPLSTTLTTWSSSHGKTNTQRRQREQKWQRLSKLTFSIYPDIIARMLASTPPTYHRTRPNVLPSSQCSSNGIPSCSYSTSFFVLYLSSHFGDMTPQTSTTTVKRVWRLLAVVCLILQQGAGTFLASMGRPDM
jgi:hypothetical protein